MSLMLAAMLVIGSLVPVSAATNTKTTTAVQSKSTVTQTADEPAEHPTLRRFNIGGLNIRFKKQTVTDEFLGQDKQVKSLQATGYRKKVTLTWAPVDNSLGIDGYIIARKYVRNSRYREIKKVNAATTTYTDLTATVKNDYYQYVVVAYKKVNGQYMVAQPSPAAGALTTKSKLKNVYTFDIDNLASVAAVMAGRGITPVVSFGKKPYSTEITWTSSNPAVASVDSTGRIVGVKAGTAVLTGRTHTGSTVSTNVTVFNRGTAQSMIDVMRAWLGYSYYNKKHRGIVDIYNTANPLPSGYRMGYWDAWCDCAVSAAALVTGNADKTGMECGVGRHVKIFKQKGIWLEGCKVTPKPGDLVVFNWYPRNKNGASHIGLVEKVEGNVVTTIEGNRGIGVCDRRTYTIGWKYVKGYARPKYQTTVTPVTPESSAAPAAPAN